jgi:signal transduction histidine kinase
MRSCFPFIVAAVCVATAHVTPATALADTAVRSIGEVLDLPLETVQRQPEVRIRGITTWRGGPFFIVQGDSEGIFIDTGKAVEQGVRAAPTIPADVVPGAIVEIDGRVAIGGFTHVVLPAEIRVVGSGPLPDVRPFNAERFFSGAESCTLVEATGVVQAVAMQQQRYALTIETDLRTFRALVHTSLIGDDPQRLVDAVVRVVGVQMGMSNTRGQAVDPQIYVDREPGFEVIEPALHAPFEGEMIPLESLGRFRRQTLRGHRINTEGMVIYAVPGEAIYLQSATNGMLVQTDFAEPLSSGDRVQVSGFLDLSSRVVGMKNAAVRRIASGSPPTPVAITADRVAEIVSESIAANTIALPGDYDGCLIRFPATLVERNRGEMNGTFVLSAGKTTVMARADMATFGRLEAIPIGSELVVTGIAQATTVRPLAVQRFQPIDTIGLILRSSADVDVVRVPPWWSPTRIAVALAGAFALAATVATGAFLWVASLRRRVAAQLAIIEDQLQANAVAEERRRIAREFHDSLDQGLAGLSLRLDAAARQTGDAEARGVLLQQHRLLASLQKEARDFLWDLRYPTHVDGLLSDSIQSQLLYMRSLTPLPLALENHCPPLALPQLEHYQLVRIVREAVNNCVRHAGAHRITVHLDGTMPDVSPGFVQIEVQDDGIGFDAADRTNAFGHFGIRGMQERARRIGAELMVDSGPGRGTRIIVRLPLPQLRSPPSTPSPAAEAPETRPSEA